MLRRIHLLLQVLTPVALATGVVATPAPAADGRAQAAAAKAADEIKRTGKLSAGSYWPLAEALHGGARRTGPARAMLTPKAPAAGRGGAALANPAGRSTVTTVGGAGLPAGFGQGFAWDRSQDEALLVLFINAADSLGVRIDGLQAGDQVQVLQATGIASFSEDEGNPLASSLVGLAAAGVDVGITALGAPEVAPLVDSAKSFAQDQFKATHAKTKRRDPFGVDPGTGHKAREEGGVLVCLPQAGGTFYSGDGDHKGRWIQGDGTRTDDHRPAHMGSAAFFPRQNVTDPYTATQPGSMFVLAWDWKFEDNAGFYEVVVKLKKGSSVPPPPILKKSPSQTPPKPKGRP